MAETGNGESDAGARRMKVVIDDRNLETVYANAVDGFSSHEEVAIMLGIQRPVRGKRGEMLIAMSHQLIMPPSAAKGLLRSLERIVASYEKSHGEIVLPQMQVDKATPEGEGDA